MSALKSLIPKEVRISAYIMIIATFVTLADLVLAAVVPDIHKALGAFIALIVVNCMILGRQEAFAAKTTVGRAILDAVGTGTGFFIALFMMGAVREVLGNGTLLGFAVMGQPLRALGHHDPAPGRLPHIGHLPSQLQLVEGPQDRDGASPPLAARRHQRSGRRVMGDLIWIFISAMLVNNFTLVMFLGLCPFLGVLGRVATALRMGLANIFVLVITSIAASVPQRLHPALRALPATDLVHRGHRVAGADRGDGHQEDLPDALP